MLVSKNSQVVITRSTLQIKLFAVLSKFGRVNICFLGFLQVKAYEVLVL